MNKRLQLHNILESIMGTENGAHVYYQPPPSLQMKYPCIRYYVEDIDTSKANNRTYHRKDIYRIDYITDEPDDVLINKLLDLPYISFDRKYISDRMYHYVMTLFF